jgi:hypothetical protein
VKIIPMAMLMAGVGMGLAVVYLEARQQSLAASGDAMTTANTLTFNSGPEVILIKCDKVGDNVPPSQCHLTEGHTLDDVMAVLWQQNEDRRAMYQAEADMLKHRMKLIPPIKEKGAK